MSNNTIVFLFSLALALLFTATITAPVHHPDHADYDRPHALSYRVGRRLLSLTPGHHHVVNKAGRMTVLRPSPEAVPDPIILASPEPFPDVFYPWVSPSPEPIQDMYVM